MKEGLRRSLGNELINNSKEIVQPPADTSQQVSVSLFQLKAFSEDLVNVPSGFIVSEGKKTDIFIVY